jgi:hypothetical protein
MVKASSMNRILGAMRQLETRGQPSATRRDICREARLCENTVDPCLRRLSVLDLVALDAKRGGPRGWADSYALTREGRRHAEAVNALEQLRAEA